MRVRGPAGWDVSCVYVGDFHLHPQEARNEGLQINLGQIMCNNFNQESSNIALAGPPAAFKLPACPTYVGNMISFGGATGSVGSIASPCPPTSQSTPYLPLATGTGHSCWGATWQLGSCCQRRRKTGVMFWRQMGSGTFFGYPPNKLESLTQVMWQFAGPFQTVGPQNSTEAVRGAHLGAVPWTCWSSLHLWLFKTHHC